MDIRNKVKNKNQNKISRAEEVFALENNQKEKFEFKKKFEKFKVFLSLNFKRIKISAKDHWHLLIKSAAQNHLRIQECKKPQAGQACNLEFGSYSELKRYQKKVRLFTYSFSSTIFSIVIAIFVAQTFFGIWQSQGATFTWIQSDWLINNTGATASHAGTGPASNFKDYASIDIGYISPVNVDSGTGSDIELILQDGSLTQISDNDFNGGTKNNVIIRDSGDLASVKLAPDLGSGVDGKLDLSLGNAINGCDQVNNPTVFTWTVATQTCTINTNNKSTFNFADVDGVSMNIPSGTTLTATGSIPLIFYARAQVFIDGSINLDGAVGGAGVGLGGTATGGIGGLGGPGGGNGGNGSIGGAPTQPTGPGAGTSANQGNGSGAGHGGIGSIKSPLPGGVTYDMQDVGGSGGGGSSGCNPAYPVMGGGGGGGGGSLKILSNDINISSTGSISANGGNGGNGSGSTSGNCQYGGAGGSGGRIFLATDNSLINNGLIRAIGGNGSALYQGVGGGGGRIFFQSLKNAVSGTGTASVLKGSGGSPGNGVVATVNNLGAWYFSSGTFISSQIDLNQRTSASSIELSWDQALNGLTQNSVGFQIASDVAPGGIANFYGPNGTTDINDLYLISAGQTLNVQHNGARYLKYKIYLSTTNTTITPEVNSVTFNYQHYPTGKTLTSSWYNTTDPANAFTWIGWSENESLPNGTNIKFQVQTAQNNEMGQGTEDDVPGIATGFMGPDGTGGSYFSSVNVDCLNSLLCTKTNNVVRYKIPLSIAVGDSFVADQWLQYKFFEDSDGQYTPRLEDVRMEYLTNATPVVSEIIADQDSTGIINLSYRLLDIDSDISSVHYTADIGAVLGENLAVDDGEITLSGSYVNLPEGEQTIQIDQEQILCKTRNNEKLGGLTPEMVCNRGINNTRRNVHNQNSIVWFIARTASGFGKSEDMTNAGTWTIKDDLPQIFAGVASVRVVANDGADANQVSMAIDGESVSTAFELDTKDPLLKAANLGLSITPVIIDRIASRADTDNARLTIVKPDSQNNIEDTNFDVYIKQVATTTACDDATDGIQESDKYPGSPFLSSTSFAESTNPETGVVGKYFNLNIPYTDSNQDPRKVCLRIKDAKGNITEKEVITPTPPNNDVKFYDFSQIDANPANSSFKELVVWGLYNDANSDFAKYEVYRASKTKAWVEANPAGVPEPSEFEKLAHADATVTNINNNYFFDRFTDIADKSNMLDTYFFYKVVVTDKFGNVSALSAPRVADIPNGQGGSDTKAPDLTINPVTNKNVSWAEISTTSDEIVSAQVFYSTDLTLNELADFTDQNSINIADPSYTEDHSIIINGLTKNTTYNVLVKVVDPSNNTTEKLTTFTTNDGPQIANVTFERNSNTEATIYWTSDNGDNAVGGSTSKVSYSPTKSSDGKSLNAPIIEEDLDITKTHRVTIKNLTPGVRYYFSVSSTRSSQEAIDNNGGVFYNILTTMDSDAPIISDIQTPLISFDTVAIQWLTDPQPSVGKVLYKKKGASSFAQTAESFTYDSSHYVIISNLEADTDYTFKVYARNINGNENTSSEFDFTTEKDASFNHLPLAKIESINAPDANLSDTSALLTFTTVDEIGGQVGSACKIDLTSIKDGKSTVITEAESGWEGEKNYNATHAIALANLDIFTDYSFTIACHDNIVKDENEDDIEKKYEITTGVGSFKTKEQMYTAAGAGALLDTTAPAILNVKVASTTGESATITWDTNEIGSSSVGFGITATNENVGGDQIVNESKDKYATSHSVTLNGLIPATKYIFKATSLDKAGNIGTSAESSFTTASPSSLSSIKAESLNLGEAQITWNTSSETSSTVEYGLTTSYGEKKESSTLTKEHSISLSNLNQGVTYHFRVKGQDKDKKLYASSDQTFEPKSPPQVKDISVNDITEHEATISFNTNIPTTATVVYTNIQDPADNGSQADNEMATKHSIQIKNLTQGATFKIQIQARDEQGTESQTDGKDLTTGKDENPPKIDMVKTDLALAQNDKVQAIISWNTDEQATTSILYKEGRNADPKEISLDESMSTNHVAVITSFKPGTVYYFNTKSVDASGNVAKSTDYALLTPRRKENIIQIIIGNFTDIFGWAKF